MSTDTAINERASLDATLDASPAPASVSRAPMWAAFAIFFIEAFAFASLLPRLPELKAAFELSEGDLGLVLLALPAGALAIMPVAGWASTRLSVRSLNAVCMSWMFVTIVAVGLVGSVGVLVPLLFAMGLGSGSMGVAMNAAGFDAERRMGRPVLSRCHAMFSLGLASGGLVAGLFLRAEASILLHLAIVHAVLFAILFVALRFVSSERPGATAASVPQDDDGTPGGDAPTDADAPRFAWPSGALLVPALVALGCLLAEGAALDWSAIYLANVLEADGALLAAGVTVFAGAMAAARFAGDALSARFGSRMLAAMGAGLSALGYAVVAAAPTAPVAFAGFVLVGLGLAPIVPVAFRVAAALVPHAPGVGVAAVSTLGYVGFLLGPAMVGLVAEATSLRWSFTAIAAILAGVLLLASRLAISANDDVS